jgi:hypothetical protein
MSLAPPLGADAEERDRREAVSAVRHFLEPAPVAVIGAGRRPDSVGATLLRNIRESFSGPAYARPHRAGAGRCAGFHGVDARRRPVARRRRRA